MVLRQRQKREFNSLNNSSRLGGVMKTVNNYGRLCLYIEMFIYVFIGLIFLGIGIYFVNTKSKFTETTTGKIIEVYEGDEGKKCKKILTAKKNRIIKSYNCTYNVEFKVGEKTYTRTFTENKLKSRKNEGETVNLQYNPMNPSDVRLKQLGNKAIGAIFIVIGIIFLGLGLFSYYMSKTTGGGLLFGNSCMWGFGSSMIGGGNSYFGRNYNASSFNN